MPLTEQERWTARNFIGSMADAFDPDQSYASQDAYPYNPTRQYAVIGPFGSGLEGGTGRASGAMGFNITPNMLMIGAALAVAFFMFKKG